MVPDSTNIYTYSQLNSDMEANKKLKKNRADQKVTSILPDDVIEAILSRLPVKSLLRSKSVAKSWDATISNPRFSETYNIQQSKSQNLSFVCRAVPGWPPTTFPLIKFERRKLRTESFLMHPPGKYPRPLCSCNGVLLLHDLRSNIHTLWNPSLRKHAVIQCPHTIENVELYGLYHDPRTDDYKVVIINVNYYAVFSCKNGAWTERRDSPCSGYLYPDSAVFVDGCFYWWLRPKDRETHNGAEMVCFDVRDEELRTMQQPRGLIVNDSDMVRLVRLSGRLCMYRRSRDRSKLQLWEIEGGEGNYSWKELINMEKEESNLLFYKPVCLTNDGDVVIRLLGSRFVVYNRCEKRFGKSWRYCMYYCELFLCPESLFFPIQNNINPVRENAGD